jgi:ATP-dependent exoDNAse (exonuclease V) alpha subunit
MVDEWWAARSAGKEVAMVALRHSDVDDLNGRARLHVVAAGRVSGPELEVNERLYQAGDEIVCLRNDYRLGVRNGDQAMVERVDAERRTMRVRLADGVRTLPTDYLDEGHIAHAYATTIHKAQGSTVNRSLVLGTDDLYREAGYVALSRGREANTLYTVGGWGLDEDLTHAPSRERGEGADLVREGLSRENSKRLAVEEPDIDRAEQDAGLRRIRARLDALEQRGQQVPDRNLGL